MPGTSVLLYECTAAALLPYLGPSELRRLLPLLEEALALGREERDGLCTAKSVDRGKMNKRGMSWRAGQLTGSAVLQQ